ncbi:uncharacterized protein LOC123475695 [Daphnia magna]|uniref:uncharacterized protein LOC123475695 n=1 Tax=Daphnia magna TaxID=35525 RepID=UPI001E1BA217|nr:uncharacterized protein LOC123475695 [Daphnia magna]
MACANKSLAHVVKFDGSNLPLWRLGLDVALEEHDVQSVTDGTLLCPPEIRQVTEQVPSVEGGPVTPTYGPIINTDAIREWKIKDCTARRILLTTIELKLQNTLVGCKTAFQIWTRLNSQHNKCAANNKYIIQRSFLNYEYQTGHSAMDHITAIETIAEQLKNMGEPQTRLQICTKIIYTLPPHLHGFIAVWEALPEEEQTIALLTAKILNEEKGTVEDMVVAEEVFLAQVNTMMVHLLPRNPDTTDHYSGATAHCTRLRHLLRNVVTVSKGSWVIQGFRGAQADVEAYRDIVYEATVNGQKRVGILRRVLYAPNTGINLISIGQITALGVSVNFSGSKCEFVRNNKVEVTGRRTGSTLYKLDIKAIVESPQQECVLIAEQSAASLITWHRRLSHVNCKTIEQMEASNAVEGMKITNRNLPAVCEGCIYGKMCRRSFKCSNKEPKPLEIVQLIVSDVGGPMQEKSLSGALYYLAIKDKASGFRQIFFLKRKSEVADNGTEFKGQDWIWVDEMGIKRQYTIAFTPQQNGASERDNRTIVEAARSALYGRKHVVSSHVLLRLWAEAANYAVYTLNRTLSRTRDVTPFEKLYDEKRQKWDKKGEKGMFLGYDNNSTGYRVFILATFKVVISDEVLFEEDDDSYEPQSRAILQKFPFAKEQTIVDETDDNSLFTDFTP